MQFSQKFGFENFKEFQQIVSKWVQAITVEKIADLEDQFYIQTAEK